MYMHPINKHFGSLFGFVRDIAQGRMGASKKNMVDCFMMSQHKGADSVGRLAQQKELWGREPARDVSELDVGPQRYRFHVCVATTCKFKYHGSVRM